MLSGACVPAFDTPAAACVSLVGLGGVVVLIAIAVGALVLWRRHEQAKQAEEEAAAEAARTSGRGDDPGASAR